jgi:hypothetical protein
VRAAASLASVWASSVPGRLSVRTLPTQRPNVSSRLQLLNGNPIPGLAHRLALYFFERSFTHGYQTPRIPEQTRRCQIRCRQARSRSQTCTQGPGQGTGPSFQPRKVAEKQRSRPHTAAPGYNPPGASAMPHRGGTRHASRHLITARTGQFGLASVFGQPGSRRAERPFRQAGVPATECAV